MPWSAALLASILLTGVVYHLLLRADASNVGLGIVTDWGMHTVVPVACLMWWLVFSPKQHLDYGDLPLFILWPCLYGAYALARGALDGVYPYGFMDLSTRQPEAVALTFAAMLIALTICGVVLVMIGRFADR